MPQEYVTETTQRLNGMPFEMNGSQKSENQQLVSRPEEIDAETIREELRQKALSTPLALLESVYADLTKLTSDQVRYLAQSNRDFVDTKIKTTIEIPVK